MSDEDLVVVELVVEAWALNLYSERYLGPQVLGR